MHAALAEKPRWAAPGAHGNPALGYLIPSSDHQGHLHSCTQTSTNTQTHKFRPRQTDTHFEKIEKRKRKWEALSAEYFRQGRSQKSPSGFPGREERVAEVFLPTHSSFFLSLYP